MFALVNCVVILADTNFVSLTDMARRAPGATLIRLRGLVQH